MKVLGIDLSSASTGMALVGADGLIGTCTVAPKGARGRDRFRPMMEAVEAAVRLEAPDVVGIENPAHGATSGAKDVVYGFWWYATQLIDEAGVPWYTVMPSSRAKFATGNGRAAKDDVLAAVTSEFGEVRNHDEADAVVVAAMGSMALGQMIGRGVSGRSLEGVKWRRKCR